MANNNTGIQRPRTMVSRRIWGAELFTESHELENEVRKRLGAIGYEL